MGFEGSESAVALVGMDGFRLLAATEINGELHQLVETTAAFMGCPGCGTRAVSKGRRTVRVRDLPAGGRRVVVVWRKRIWRCPDSDREVAAWTEKTEAIAPRVSVYNRMCSSAYGLDARATGALDADRARRGTRFPGSRPDGTPGKWST